MDGLSGALHLTPRVLLGAALPRRAFFAAARRSYGHSVEVMLRMYAAWIEGATEADIQAIRDAWRLDQTWPLLPVALASPRDSACQIVLRPLESPHSASRSASSPEGQKVSLEKVRKKVAERVGFESTSANNRIRKLRA
jgi:hypothetical protein